MSWVCQQVLVTRGLRLDLRMGIAEAAAHQPVSVPEKVQAQLLDFVKRRLEQLLVGFVCASSNFTLLHFDTSHTLIPMCAYLDWLPCRQEPQFWGLRHSRGHGNHLVPQMCCDAHMWSG